MLKHQPEKRAPLFYEDIMLNPWAAAKSASAMSGRDGSVGS
jgi:hypothetical protein